MSRAFPRFILVASGTCLLLAAQVMPAADGVHRDLEFTRRGNTPLRLDLYVPKTAAPPPLIVWIHGGGWTFGGKGFRLLIRKLTAQGFAIASIDYRFSQVAIWPAQIDDCKAALDWLRKNGEAYGVDTSRIALSGDSAGGHLSALLGVKEGTPKIRAVVPLYPPTDLLVLGEHFRDNPRNLIVKLLGGPFEETRKAAAAASPVTYVTPDDPPFLFLHGDEDKVVPLSQSELMDRKLRDAGVSSRILVFKGRGHAFGLNEFELDQVAEFFRTHMQDSRTTR